MFLDMNKKSALFLTSVILSIFFIISAIYYYGKFDKGSTGKLTSEESASAKNMTIILLILAILSLISVFMIYFDPENLFIEYYN